jgi:pimeloyl-ACP methyl ester carboxylesterase
VIDAYPDPVMTEGSFAIASSLGAWWLAAQGAGVPGESNAATATRRARHAAAFDPQIARRFAEQLSAGETSRLDLWPFWQAAECPALLVRGAESTVLPAPLAAEMVRRRPGTECVVVQGVGHQVPLQRPVETARAVERFAYGGPDAG